MRAIPSKPTLVYRPVSASARVTNSWEPPATFLLMCSYNGVWPKLESLRVDGVTWSDACLMLPMRLMMKRTLGELPDKLRRVIETQG